MNEDRKYVENSSVENNDRNMREVTETSSGYQNLNNKHMYGDDQ